MIKSDIYHKRSGNFHFLCDWCQTKYENDSIATQDDKIDNVDRHVQSLDKTVMEFQNIVSNSSQNQANDSDTNAKVGLLEQRVNGLSESITELKDLFVNSLKNLNVIDHSSTPNHSSPTLPPPKPLFSTVVSKPSVLIVKDDPKGTFAKDETSVDDMLLQESIKINKSRKKPDGSTVFVCSNANEREKLQKKLATTYPEIKTHQPAEIIPTISIANIPIKHQKDNLKELFMIGNPEIKALVNQNEEFIVLAAKPQLRDKTKQQAIVRVSNNIRKAIELQGNRQTGANSCNIYDHFYIKRCNRCQKFNHFKAECKAKHPTCGHCSNDHDSEKCPN